MKKTGKYIELRKKHPAILSCGSTSSEYAKIIILENKDVKKLIEAIRLMLLSNYQLSGGVQQFFSTCWNENSRELENTYTYYTAILIDLDPLDLSQA